MFFICKLMFLTSMAQDAPKDAISSEKFISFWGGMPLPRPVSRRKGTPSPHPTLAPIKSAGSALRPENSSQIYATDWQHGEVL